MPPAEADAAEIYDPDGVELEAPTLLDRPRGFPVFTVIVLGTLWL